MPPTRARTGVRIVLAWSVLALVAWQAAASLASVAAELGAPPLARHLRVLRETPLELQRRKLGAVDFELLQALRARVPAGTRVLVACPEAPETLKELKQRLTWIGSLAYPIVLKAWPRVGARAARTGARGETQPGRREFVLDLDSGEDFSAWPVEELARGAGWCLSRVGGAR